MKNKMSKETMMKIGGAIAVLVTLAVIVSSVFGGDSKASAEGNATVDQSKKMITTTNVDNSTKDNSVHAENYTDNSKKVNTGDINTQGNVSF